MELDIIKKKLELLNETCDILKSHPDSQKARIFTEKLLTQKEVLLLHLFEETLAYAKEK